MDPLTLAAFGLAMNPGVQQGVSNVLGSLPVIGDLFGGGQSDAEKALIRRQEQLAQEARRRQERNALQAPRLQATAQQLGAFGPVNQMMAEQYGAGAAFAPGELANMVQNPMGFPDIDTWAKQQGFEPTRQQGQANFNAAVNGDQLPGTSQSLVDYRGLDPEIQGRVEEYIRQKKIFDEAEARRRQTLEGGRQPGGGPAPLAPRAAPAPARRF